MKQYATETARDWLSLGLAGLGISLFPHEYFGGMFLALAGASMIARHRQRGRSFATILSTAFFFATLIAVMWPAWGWEEIPVQFIMAVGGLTSGWCANIVVRFMNQVEQRTDDIADRAVDRLFKNRDEK